jgi:hypothetical protein
MTVPDAFLLQPSVLITPIEPDKTIEMLRETRREFGSRKIDDTDETAPLMTDARQYRPRSPYSMEMDFNPLSDVSRRPPVSATVAFRRISSTRRGRPALRVLRAAAISISTPVSKCATLESSFYLPETFRLTFA